MGVLPPWRRGRLLGGRVAAEPAVTAHGAVAAGHPLTAQAGAQVLRDGGNAVDAAVAAVLTSFVAESPLTGLGAGGVLLVHPADEDVLSGLFVETPGRG